MQIVVTSAQWVGFYLFKQSIFIFTMLSYAFIWSLTGSIFDDWFLPMNSKLWKNTRHFKFWVSLNQNFLCLDKMSIFYFESLLSLRVFLAKKNTEIQSRSHAITFFGKNKLGFSFWLLLSSCKYCHNGFEKKKLFVFFKKRPLHQN